MALQSTRVIDLQAQPQAHFLAQQQLLGSARVAIEADQWHAHTHHARKAYAQDARPMDATLEPIEIPLRRWDRGTLIRYAPESSWSFSL